MRRLLVRASSRSIARATSSGRSSVHQRSPTRRTSPRRSRSYSRAIVLSLLRPTARAAIALENEPGILRSAARRRSGRRSVRGSVRGSPARGFGSESGLAAAGAGSGAGSDLRPTGGSSPKRARQPPHKTTGPRSAERTISSRRHARPEWQPPQRRPARSISVRSSALSAFTYHIVAAAERPLNATGDERSVALTLSRGGRVRTLSRLISVPPCRLSHLRARCARSTRGSGPCATSVSASP